jgi:hypothetical protein
MSGAPPARADRALVVIALGLAVVAGIVLLFLPAYNDGSTIVEVNGGDVVLFLFMPALICAAVLLADPWKRRLHVQLVASFLLLLFVFLGIFSIGVFYLPAAGAMSAAALIGSRD